MTFKKGQSVRPRQRKAHRVSASLLRKGFKAEGKDHIFFTFFAFGKRTAITTKISLGAVECGPYHLREMAKQLHLTRDQFTDLLNCHLKMEDYARILCERGILDYREIPQLSLNDVAATDNKSTYGQRRTQ